MKEVETKRKALGKGLEQLFTNERLDFNEFEKNIVKNATEQDIIKIPLNEIRSNPYQPRKTFDEEKLKELSLSIKEHGIIEPIIVKKSIKGYELVAGERRTKAAKLAGFTKIPAIIRDFDDEQMMEIALIENIQRENLNAIEEARAYDIIIKTNGITQEELATKFGKSRSYITNMLGLLNLSNKVQESILKNEISMSHARAISKIESYETQEEILGKIIKEHLSVRDIEKLISGEDISKRVKLKRKELPSLKYAIYEKILREKIGTKVKISNKKIDIPFDSDKDLERILQILNIELDKD